MVHQPQARPAVRRTGRNSKRPTWGEDRSREAPGGKVEGRCETDRVSAPRGARRCGAPFDGQALIGGPRNEEGRAEAAHGTRKTKYSPPGIRSGYEPDSGRQVNRRGRPETVRAFVGQTKGKAGASAGTNDLTASGRGGDGGMNRSVLRRSHFRWKNFGRPKFWNTTS